MKRIIPYLLLLVSAAFLSVQWLWPEKEPKDQKRYTSEKINLALRQTGHQLLSLQGDSTSTIFPVQIKSENEYVLQLKSEFNYDTLPYLLHAALTDYGILAAYHVAVKNCETDTLILGYNHLAYENENVACLGREQWSTCSNISVIFENKSKFGNGRKWLATSIGLIGVLLFFRLYILEKQKNGKGQNEIPSKNSTLKIGSTIFDFTNQNISINGENKSLTFRENKLLHFFAGHPNQILEREKILSEVWGDEGVIVGRSLDVFVSRLRKLLKEDTSLKIKNVHGVGYRLEVKN